MRSVATLLLNLPPHFLVPWGYVIIFIASILEALPLVGSFIPGHTIVILGGFFAKLHFLRLGKVILISMLGALIGDTFAYVLGRKYGYTLITKYGKYVSLQKKHYKKLRSLVLNNTGKTLILSRFNPFSRAFAPFIAGSSEVKFYRFFVYAMMGTFSWAIISILIGYIFGASFEVAAQYTGKILAVATILAIVLIYLYNQINKKKNIFSKYYLHVFTLCIVMLYIAAKMFEDVITNDSVIIKWDIWVSANISVLWTPFLTSLMKLVTLLFTPSSMLVMIFFLLVWLAYKKQWHHAILLLLSTATACGTDLITESIMQRARPDMSLVTAAGYGFPSGHAVLVALLFGFIIYAFKDSIKEEANRALFITGSILMIILISFSRIYLNVHWLSDVIAGISISLFWLTFWILFLRFANRIKSAMRTFTDEYAPYNRVIEHIPY